MSRAAVPLPPEVLADAAERGAARIGAYPERLLRAVGIPVSDGNTPEAAGSMPFARLDADRQQAELATGRQELVERGLAEAVPTDSPPEQVPIQGDLAWIRKAAAKPVDFRVNCQYTGDWGTGGPALWPSGWYGVRTADDVVLICLDQDLGRGEVTVVVRSLPGAATEFARTVFTDGDLGEEYAALPLNRRAPDGSWLLGRYGQLQVARRSPLTGTVQGRFLRAQRQREGPTAEVLERRTVGRHRSDSDTVDEDALRRHTLDLLRWGANGR